MPSPDAASTCGSMAPQRTEHLYPVNLASFVPLEMAGARTAIRPIDLQSFSAGGMQPWHIDCSFGSGQSGGINPDQRHFRDADSRSPSPMAGFSARPSFR